MYLLYPDTIWYQCSDILIIPNLKVKNNQEWRDCYHPIFILPRVPPRPSLRSRRELGYLRRAPPPGGYVVDPPRRCGRRSPPLLCCCLWGALGRVVIVVIAGGEELGIDEGAQSRLPVYLRVTVTQESEAWCGGNNVRTERLDQQ